MYTCKIQASNVLYFIYIYDIIKIILIILFKHYKA
uniref:Uncharacterized protein n=1 Tax=Bostrychia simpliciuscula TaxID=324754 RepID=A0A1Z1M7Q6_9FLOR|nr:hypothetical protein [Bostrychia simpliciuscula]ARW62009.1 hypothetical protein [Bostrychia simpliciuscula]